MSCVGAWRVSCGASGARAVCVSLRAAFRSAFLGCASCVLEGRCASCRAPFTVAWRVACAAMSRALSHAYCGGRERRWECGAILRTLSRAGSRWCCHVAFAVASWSVCARVSVAACAAGFPQENRASKKLKKGASFRILLRQSAVQVRLSAVVVRAWARPRHLCV